MWIEINRSKGVDQANDYSHALNFFLENEPQDIVVDTIRDLTRLIDLKLSETQLEEAIRKDYFAAVLPSLWKMTYNEWLVQVRDYLKANLKRKHPNQ